MIGREGQEIDWELQNAEEQAARHPETFEIPPLRRRRSLELGEFVQMRFLCVPQPEGGPVAERIWVEVVEAGDPEAYRGRIANLPNTITTLFEDEVIEFSYRNVIAVER